MFEYIIFFSYNYFVCTNFPKCLRRALSDSVLVMPEGFEIEFYNHIALYNCKLTVKVSQVIFTDIRPDRVAHWGILKASHGVPVIFRGGSKVSQGISSSSIGPLMLHSGSIAVKSGC